MTTTKKKLRCFSPIEIKERGWKLLFCYFVDNERKAGHKVEDKHQPFLDSIFPNRLIAMGCLEQVRLTCTEGKEYKLEWGTEMK